MANSNGLKLPSLQRLQSAEQMELLDVVDSLRAQGLSEIVALPQLIVCGDQSSGKSSVLEAISGIPFPRQENLCTRFATEVILRRAAKNEISVSIVPGKDRAPPELDQLLKFGHELTTQDDFKGLFKAAGDAMGLSSSGKSFSNDILKIEFCGPSQPQLTLVDLPGLIHSETKSQTAGDVQLVHNLVLQYLKNPRSIILAVVSSKNDISNQIILQRARQVDPRGLRTLGIITKPDTLVKGSKNEESFIALARNEDVKFSLGWHVVKNLDSAIKNDEDHSRDELEDLFFKESHFSRLPTNTVGITFLRTRLSKVLFNQIQTELPRLVEDIQSQVTAARIIQDRLGPSRAELEEQRSFLISISQSFQSICRDAVRGDYDHEFFQDDPNPERRLCANIMNLHFRFAEKMRKSGASWVIVDEETYDPKCRTREKAIKEASKLLKRSRGRELPGLPNPLLVGELFREYSRPWEDLARLHIKNVWEAANRFLELAIKYLADEDACEKVLRFWLYPIMDEKLNSAYDKLNELLEVHKDHPLTTNYHFINNTKPKDADSKKGLEETLKKEFTQPGQKMTIDEISRLLSNMSPNDAPDMDMIAAEEAFNNMNAFYEVAMNLFTDNVPTLAIQAPIIREVPKIFCPTAVFSMDADIIKKIAGESKEKSLERAAIVRRLEILENGARICKQYAKRPQSCELYPNMTYIEDKADVLALVSLSNDRTKVESPVRSKESGKRPISERAKSPATSSPFNHYVPPTWSNPFETLPEYNTSSPSMFNLKNESQTAKDPKPASPFSLFGSHNLNTTKSGEDGAKSKMPFGSPSPGIGSPSPGIGSPSPGFERRINGFGAKPSFVSSTSSESSTATASSSIFGRKSDVSTSGASLPQSSTQAKMARMVIEATPPTYWTPYKTNLYQTEGFFSGPPSFDEFQSISSMPKFQTFSYEELRLRDYMLVGKA
ncbi:Uncharacterized protein BP5553_06529 [Venustampulla echinocandica]|uniref:P-loop containing nucleoside triphosphate hydrolase n=1 Tax=Venustampulla echinocandica TaxID=2656787 RepID=A0A370TK75_9HELO|nr:Uncharacterized protein BP5553_06529 [Venustampulla echinocandica]RDL35917.1 Uncharacterized protein BP5553_06529 [Venustampulla echinocandica]